MQKSRNIRNVENIGNVAEYIRNVDPEQFANIREVFEEFKEMDVEFEEIRWIKIPTKKCYPTILVMLDMSE